MMERRKREAYKLAEVFVIAPTNTVLNSSGGFVEADMWRKEGIAFINLISRELLA